MKTEQSLLDYLAMRLGCLYLSDLRFLGPWQTVCLIREIKQIPACAAPAREWNDALKYLVGAVPEQSADLAKKRCIALLEQSAFKNRQSGSEEMRAARNNQPCRLSSLRG